jgi:hypothetical protein
MRWWVVVLAWVVGAGAIFLLQRLTSSHSWGEDLGIAAVVATISTGGAALTTRREHGRR